MSARLTPEGASLVKRSRQVLRRWVGANFAAHLSDDELRSLVSILQRLLEGLGRWEGQIAHLSRPLPGAD